MNRWRNGKLVAGGSYELQDIMETKLETRNTEHKP